MKKVVIIIPTYNEAAVIEDTLTQVFNATASVSDKDIHVLIFDSASTDNTVAIVTRMQNTYKNLHLKTEPEKSGLGSAYLQAMNHALDTLAANIVIEYDADLSHQPKYIAPILEKMDSHDVVVGSRYVPGGCIPSNWAWNRKLLSVLGNYVARLLLTRKYRDFTSGFRATCRQALLKALPPRFISSQYAYKLELLWALHKNKARIGEHPIEFIDREKGQSKLPANSVRDSLRVLFTLRYRELKRYFSMCLVGLTGLLVQCLVYNVLRLGLSPFHAVMIATTAALLNNFTLNSQFTFKREGFRTAAQKIKSFALFSSYSLVMSLLQGYWLDWATSYFGLGFIKENIIVFCGVIIGSVLNYLTYSHIVWPVKQQPET